LLIPDVNCRLDEITKIGQHALKLDGFGENWFSGCIPHDTKSFKKLPEAGPAAGSKA